MALHSPSCHCCRRRRRGLRRCTIFFLLPIFHYVLEKNIVNSVQLAGAVGTFDSNSSSISFSFFFLPIFTGCAFSSVHWICILITIFSLAEFTFTAIASFSMAPKRVLIFLPPQRILPVCHEKHIFIVKVAERAISTRSVCCAASQPAIHIQSFCVFFFLSPPVFQHNIF